MAEWVETIIEPEATEAAWKERWERAGMLAATETAWEDPEP
jgi:hypothetical protein